MEQADKKDCTDLAGVLQRVKQRRKDYIRYDFTRKKNDILKTFFDLAQEFDTLKDLYRICVTVPYEFMHVESRLYLLDEKDNLVLVCDCDNGVAAEPSPAPDYIRLTRQAYEAEGSYIVPIAGKFLKTSDVVNPQITNPIIGLFEIYPADKLNEEDRFFFAKYTNRIGYNIHNKTLTRQNLKHLRFINNLVMDIEHNVIIPNMHFKYLFNQLRRKIDEMAVLQQGAQRLKEELNIADESCAKMISDIDLLQRQLDECNQQLQKHHMHMSLFLESLFRRDHFEKGRLVIQPKKCLVEKEIIVPQLEHYMGRLKARNIQIVRPHDMLEEEIPLMVDVGLLAQVYANLFSNAVKYTEEVQGPDNRTMKIMAYGRDLLPDFFGPQQDGIKLNVFTTGERLDDVEAVSVFDEGFRREASKDKPGTGHGLTFIKHVIEMHAGQVGYEATIFGNNFYFVLPLPPKEIIISA